MYRFQETLTMPKHSSSAASKFQKDKASGQTNKHQRLMASSTNPLRAASPSKALTITAATCGF